METSVAKDTSARKRSRPEYKRPEGLNPAEAIAHYLDWSAKHRPYEFNKMTEIAYCAMDLRTRPREESEDTKFCKKKMDLAKKVLLKDYGRRTIYKRGLGHRATVDDLDMVKGPGARQATIVANASKKFSDIIDSVDVDAMPNTEEAKPWKDWVPRAKQQANRLIAPSFRAALLPPGSPDKPKDGD